MTSIKLGTFQFNVYIYILYTDKLKALLQDIFKFVHCALSGHY